MTSGVTQIPGETKPSGLTIFYGLTKIIGITALGSFPAPTPPSGGQGAYFPPHYFPPHYFAPFYFTS